MIAALLVGTLFGFFGAMPLAGPVALVVFSKGMEGHRRAALFTAAGASAAEFAYAWLAFLGFATLLAQIDWVLDASKLVAAFVLAALGVALIRRQSSDVREPGAESRGRTSFVVGFLLTALNPTLIATWSAAITTLYSTQIVEFQPSHALPFALGVFSGDMLWYWLMLLLIRKHSGRLGRQWLTLVLRFMGWALVALSLWFLVAFLRSMLSS